MKTKLACAAAFLALTMFAVAANAFYGAPSPTKLEGVINDYSPKSTNPMGPYLVSGPWSLQFQPSGKAEFAASLTMVRSDLSFTGLGALDPDSQAARNFHTHHVHVADGEVSFLGNAIVVSGTATVTSNGNEVFPGSTVQIEISGGTAVAPSNIKVTFGAPVSGHFTTQPYEGVVTTP